MPEISRKYRERRLAGTAGNAPARYDESQFYRETERAGRILTQLGINLFRDIKEAEYHDQLNNAKTEVAKRFFEFEQKLGADTETYLPELEELQRNLRNDLKFSNKHAEDDFAPWYENKKIQQKDLIWNKKKSIDARNFLNNFNLNEELLENTAAQAETEQEYELALIDAAESLFGVTKDKETGKLTLMEDFYNPVFDSDENRMAGFEVFKQNALIKREKFLIERTKNNLENMLLGIAKSKKNIAEGYKEALETLNDPKFAEMLSDTGIELKEQQLILSDLRERLNIKKNIAEEELKIEQEKNYKDFQTRIWNNELTDISEIRQSYLSDGISETQMNNLEGDLKNPDVETDDAAYMKVEDAILDYGSGRKTRDEVEEIFDKNLMKINKKDKTQLSKKLSSERDKYLDNQTKTGHKIISNILFSSMGSSIYDDVTGEINWAKLISGGKATAEEIAAYRRGTLIFNEWFNKLVDEKKTPKEEDIIFQALKIGNQVKRESATGQISKTLTDMQPNKSRALNVPNAVAMTFAIPSEQNLPTIKEGDMEAFKKLPKGAEFYYKGRRRTKN